MEHQEKEQQKLDIFILVADFLRTICGEEPSISATDINDSTTSHRVVFKAMEAMRKGTVEKI